MGIIANFSSIVVTTVLLSFCVENFVYCGTTSSSTKPHIIVILADDLGWNDVSFHGSNQIPTPNIDALAYNGIILNQHYVQALCTPSRAAFLTGKYPIHTGMQHLVILENEPWGLPLEEKLLPEYLHEAGYATHAVGKWHLGYFKKEYTPTYRGFDSHFGYWNGIQDYYDHTVATTFKPLMKGLDLRRNMSVVYDADGKYATDLYTDEAIKLINKHNASNPMFLYFSHLAPHTGNRDNPLQAPDEEIAKFSHIEDPERRVYAAMVSLLDKSVGEVIAALRAKRMLENSIVLFLADNGAQTFGIHANHGSNYPLRGMKGSAWEGGVRGVGAVWSPLLNNSQIVSNQLMHISDWLPTLMSAAGLNTSSLGNIDGVDMWSTLSNNQGNGRSEIVINIDDKWNYASLRIGDWKYVNGSPTTTENEWYGDSGLDLDLEHSKYDEEAVLFSKAGIALTGTITSLQIKEKQIKSEGDFVFSQQLLSTNKISSLRKQATVQCTRDYSKANNQTICRPTESACLFNIKEDPCERINFASLRPQIIQKFETTLKEYRKTIVEPINKPADLKANPQFWNNTWTNWQDQPIHKIKTFSQTTLSMLIIVVALFLVVIIILLIISLKGCDLSCNKRGKSKFPFKSYERNRRAANIEKGFKSSFVEKNDELLNECEKVDPNVKC